MTYVLVVFALGRAESCVYASAWDLVLALGCAPASVYGMSKLLLALMLQLIPSEKLPCA